MTKTSKNPVELLLESVNEILAENGVTLPTEVREDIETEFEACGTATETTFRLQIEMIDLFADKLSAALFVLMRSAEELENGGSELVEGKTLSERLRLSLVGLAKFQRGNPAHVRAINAISDALPDGVKLCVIDEDELGKRGFDA